MTITDVNLCSNALIKIGASPLTSFEDGTAEAEVAANLYPQIRDALLSSYPWSFAVGQKTLARLESRPLADFKYAYALPYDFLRIISAGNAGRGSGLEYRIFENKMHTNAEHVTITYIFRPHVDTFPAFFVEALMARLAAEFCIPLTESTTRADFLSRLAEDAITQARLIDAQQATPRKFEDFTLVEARQ